MTARPLSPRTCESRLGRRVNRMDAKMLGLNRLLERTEKTATCWLWRGAIGSTGYGLIRFGGGVQRAHRVSYQLHVGPIPRGQFVCHSCDVRACINPAHLWSGTASDNMRDCANKGRAFLQNNKVEAAKRTLAARTARYAVLSPTCKKGHPFSGDNLFLRRDGSRGCRACTREANRAYWQRTFGERP